MNRYVHDTNYWINRHSKTIGSDVYLL